MPTFKLVLADPMSGKSKQLEVKDPHAQRLIGLRIGDIVDASVLKGIIDLPQGFRIKITGGSGYEGAPMVPYIEGPVKKYVLASGPPGFHPRRRGERKRKLVRGNTINEQIVQINAVLIYPAGWKEGPIIPLGDKELNKIVEKLKGGEQEQTQEQ
ncbi:MAG: 30S ribosomal protein S6e [Crenarchaeota archaeon]|nr:30S ribosomal protein S6e [Thermoproteota archaeon]